MIKRKELVGIFIFFLLSLLMWAGLSAMPGAEPVTIPERSGQGYDLRGYDFENNIVFIPTDRIWESYPEAFYTPEDFSTGAVPQYAYLEINMDYATHRLPLLLTPGQTYGLSMKSSDYAMRIYIDGKEEGSVGAPGATKETTTPRTNNVVYYFTPQAEQVDVIVHTSNFVHREGAYPMVSWLGSYENINRKQQTDLFVSLTIAGYLLASAMYHLALFLINRRRKIELIFSICCFLLLLMTKQIILIIFPYYNWFVVFRLEYIVHYAVFAGLTLFIHLLFPGLLHKWLVRPYLAISGVFILTTVIADTVFSSNIIQYYDMASIFLMVWILFRLAMTLRTKRLQNWIAFTGLFVLALLGTNDILFHVNVITIPRYFNMNFNTPVGMVFFILCYAIVLALDHTETEEKARKTDFYRKMSHSLRTPLTIVSTSIQRAIHYPEDAERLLRNSQAEIMKVSDIIAKALDDGEEALNENDTLR